MDQLIALFREQAAVLAAAAQRRSLPSRRPARRRRRDAGRVPRRRRRRRDRVAHGSRPGQRIPRAALKTTQTIVGDLGFDSIMVTDLFGGVSRAFPGLVVEPTGSRPAAHSAM